MKVNKRKKKPYEFKEGPPGSLAVRCSCFLHGDYPGGIDDDCPECVQTRKGGRMEERKLLAEYDVKVKVDTKNLSDSQKRLIGEHAATLMRAAVEDQVVEANDKYMAVKPGQIIIKDWSFLDLQPGPDAQRKLFGENGGEPPTEDTSDL